MPIAASTLSSGTAWGRKDVLQPLGRWSRRLPSSEVAMDINPDFRDLLRDLSDAGVRYVIAGKISFVPSVPSDARKTCWISTVSRRQRRNAVPPPNGSADDASFPHARNRAAAVL